MKVHLSNAILIAGAGICFADIVYAPRDNDPGPWLTAVLGILLLRRAIVAVPQPAVVILSGCVLTTLVVLGNQGLLNINKPIWIGLILVAFTAFGFWERIHKLWI